MNEKVLNEARKIIAGFLKQRREELGITQAELAERTGLGIATIKRSENADFWLGLKQYLILCEALHLFPLIATYEEHSDVAEMMRKNWTAKPKAMSIDDALKLKAQKHNRSGQHN